MLSVMTQGAPLTFKEDGNHSPEPGALMLEQVSKWSMYVQHSKFFERKLCGV